MGGEHHIAHRHCTNWGGLVIQAPVNLRDGRDNRISSGRVMANSGFGKSLSKVALNCVLL